MRNIFSTIADTIFPKACISCQKEGDYLCYDCLSTIDILMSHQPYQGKYLSDLYYATSYHNRLVKNLIKNFENDPFIKGAAKPLSFIIISHFKLIENEKDYSDFLLMPIARDKKYLKWTGYNPAEEIAKELSPFFNCSLCKNNEIKGKNILLINTVFSKGCKMEEQAKELKNNGAREVLGITVARK